MTTQLMTTNKEVAVCLGCGLPRLEAEGFYPLQNDRCGRCRIIRGDELVECTGCEENVFEDGVYREGEGETDDIP